MEVLFEKVYAISHDIKEIRKMYYYGKHLHSVGTCGLETCTKDQYLNELDRHLRAALSGDVLRLQFIDASAQCISVFITIDQTQKRLGDQIFHMKTSDVIKTH